METDVDKLKILFAEASFTKLFSYGANREVLARNAAFVRANVFDRERGNQNWCSEHALSVV